MAESYKVIRKIGKGAYGSAYLAQMRSKPAVQVVIKRVSLRQFRYEEVEESVKEAQVLSMLDHPCIIKHIEHFLVIILSRAKILLFKVVILHHCFFDIYFDMYNELLCFQDEENCLCIVTELAEVKYLWSVSCVLELA